MDVPPNQMDLLVVANPRRIIEMILKLVALFTSTLELQTTVRVFSEEVCVIVYLNAL